MSLLAVVLGVVWVIIGHVAWRTQVRHTPLLMKTYTSLKGWSVQEYRQSYPILAAMYEQTDRQVYMWEKIVLYHLGGALTWAWVQRK